MKVARRYLFGIVGASLLAAGAAHADRSMVVLLDATGSMMTVRADLTTRYQAAQSQAATRVFNAATVDVEGLVNVAVLQFNSATGTISLTGGSATDPTFVDPTSAIGIINASSVSIFATPLADALCDTIAAARATSLTTTDRLIEAYTDGAENASDPAKCGGPDSTTGFPYDGGSWQHNVELSATDATKHAVQISTTLYTDVTNLARSADAGGNSNPEVGVPAAVRPLISASLGPITDDQFFGELAAATGGTLTVVRDTGPLPVFADVDGDFDVDRDDAIALARQFGAPATPAFDLDASGSVGFDDYAILISRFGTGSGTPAPDPYVQRAPVVCKGAARVVIDGQAIEDGGITINALGSCEITIKNSLIVSGKNAINVVGSATITVDHSIIVGQDALIARRGAVVLSAADSVFHGKLDTHGAFKYIDRGNNVFE